MAKTSPQHKKEQTISRYVKSNTPEAMYDIGVGLKTEWKTIPKLYPSMRVFGCEPNPDTYEGLLRDFPGILAPVAIGDPQKGRKRVLNIRPDAPGSSSLFPISGASRTYEVEVYSLDEFDQLCGSPGNILLWMDIEGAELEALQSGPRLLSSGRIKWLNLEVRDTPDVEGWATSKEIRELLSSYGYSLLKSYNDNKTHRDEIYVLEN